MIIVDHLREVELNASMKVCLIDPKNMDDRITIIIDVLIGSEWPIRMHPSPPATREWSTALCFSDFNEPAGGIEISSGPSASANQSCSSSDLSFVASRNNDCFVWNLAVEFRSIENKINTLGKNMMKISNAIWHIASKTSPDVSKSFLALMSLIRLFWLEVFLIATVIIIAKKTFPRVWWVAVGARELLVSFSGIQWSKFN